MKAHFLSVAALLVMVVLAFGSVDNSSNNTGGQPASSVSSGENKRIDGDNWFGCTDRDQFEKLVSYAVQKDRDAFGRAMTAGLMDGTCTSFKGGEEVYIVDTAIFSGLVKVRRKGATLEYWTNLEAVQ